MRTRTPSPVVPLVLAPVLLLAASCSSPVANSDTGCPPGAGPTYRVRLDAPADAPARFVVLEEVVEISGAPDSGRPYEYRVTRSCLREAGWPGVELRPPQERRFAFFWWSRVEHVRWTFLVPGSLMLSIYPRGWPITDERQMRNIAYEPTVGWRHRNGWFDYPPMAPWWPPLPQRYPADADPVALTFALRPASATAAPPRPPASEFFDPFATQDVPTGQRYPALPSGTCETDAMNFNEQVEGVLTALRSARNKLSPVARQVIRETIRTQHFALTAAGFGQAALKRDGEVMTELERLLVTP